jgi:hypothetical protein
MTSLEASLVHMPRPGNEQVRLLTVTSRVDMIGKLRYGDLKSRLNGAHHLLVCLGRHKCDRKAFGPETPSAPSGLNMLRP